MTIDIVMSSDPIDDPIVNWYCYWWRNDDIVVVIGSDESDVGKGPIVTIDIIVNYCWLLIDE